MNLEPKIYKKMTQEAIKIYKYFVRKFNKTLFHHFYTDKCQKSKYYYTVNVHVKWLYSKDPLKVCSLKCSAVWLPNMAAAERSVMNCGFNITERFTCSTVVSSDWLKPEPISLCLPSAAAYWTLYLPTLFTSVEVQWELHLMVLEVVVAAPPRRRSTS